MAFLTLTSLSGMLVSRVLTGSDANKYTNNFDEYQQSGTNNYEGQAIIARSICGCF